MSDPCNQPSVLSSPEFPFPCSQCLGRGHKEDSSLGLMVGFLEEVCGKWKIHPGNLENRQKGHLCGLGTCV